MNLKYNFLTILFFIAVIQVFGQSSGEIYLSGNSFNKERLVRVDQVINDAIAKGEIPGAVVAIADKQGTAYRKSYGYADLETKKPMVENSIFRIASMTKAVTTVGVMILLEQGHILLNDPISKYMPEFKNPQILIEADDEGNILKTRPSEKEIRIVDLLHHKSGISYPFIPTKLQKVYKKNGLIDAVSSQKVMLGDQMKILAKMPLLFEPGSEVQYGLSLDVLGYLCEIISGKPLFQFFEDEIFGPLKMIDTQYYISSKKSDRLVSLYSSTPDKKLFKSTGKESPIFIDNVNYPIEGAKTYNSGGGGLTSTAPDYSRFAQMLLNKGELDGMRILSRKSVELISKAQIDWNGDGNLDYGFGFQIEGEMSKVPELSTEGVFSGAGAFYGYFWIDPVENFTGVFMSQVLPSQTDVASKVRNMVYQALK